MGQNIEELIESLVKLGIDVSVLIKLKKAIELKTIEEYKYSHILEKISANLKKSNSVGQGMAIRFLVNQLTKSVHNDLKDQQADIINYNKIHEIVSQVHGTNTPPTTNSQDMMLVLAEITKKLENIASTPVTIVSDSVTQVASKNNLNVVMDNVFINPSDIKDLDKIKTNVTIESRSGSNIQDKLNKLKKLKEGIEEDD
jgi:hypothetical protein